MANLDNNAIECKTIKDLLERYQLVIPEIQREYVWGDPCIGKDVLGAFYEDLLDGFEQYQSFDARVAESVSKRKAALADAGVDLEDAQIQDVVRRDLEKAGLKPPTSNVGFLYAYLPEWANAAAGAVLPANLIDGQQRITTLFLVWLHISKKAGRMPEFLDVVRRSVGKDSASLMFDFKVRQKTRSFLQVLVDQIAKEGDFDFSAIDDAIWFLAEFKSDVSIVSMVHAIQAWDKVWANRPEATKFYDYLTSSVYFWLFVVRNTAQGERLYITMNGRGRNLTPAEIIRAKVFRGVEEGRADEVGRTFEDVYDFFWTHPIPGELTADAGVQKFFRWVYLLERYARWLSLSASEAASDDADVMQDFRAALQNQVRGEKRSFELKETMFDPVEGISFDLIKQTFEALRRLMKIEEDAALTVNGCGLRKYIPDSVLGCRAEDRTFQQDAFLLLPLLRFLIRRQNDSSPELPFEVIRFARYLRNLRTLRSVQKSINKIVAKVIGMADILSGEAPVSLRDCICSATCRDRLSDSVVPDEEILKASVLRGMADPELLSRTERLLWEIEDDKAENGETDAGYGISGFLSGYSETWSNKDSWTNDFVEGLSASYRRLGDFCTLQQDDPECGWVEQWLLMPAHEGYYRHGCRLVPYNRYEMMERPQLVRSIDELMTAGRASNSSPADVAKQEERQFLASSWSIRNEIGSPLTLAALALSVSRLSGGLSLTGQMRQIQFADDLPEDYPAGMDVVRIGAENAGCYFWMLPSDAKMKRYPRRDWLFPIHIQTTEASDERVREYLEEAVTGTDVDQS